MQKKDIDSLVYLIKQAKDNYRPKPIVFLGAGASISAGIPGADQIRLEILKNFKDKPEIKKLDDAEVNSYYKVMNCLNTTERHKLLRDYITDKQVKLNVTHIYLAQLIKEGYVDYVLTVNFDDLIQRACALFNFIPPVYDIAILKDFTTTTLQYQSVTHLHGQHHGFWLLNTGEELDLVQKGVAKIIERICDGRTWIIIGYSGEDPIFEHIANLGRFDNELFWVGYNDYEPGQKVKEQLLEKPNNNASWISGYDSDSFFLRLHSELKLPTPEIFNKPFSFLKEVANKIKDIEQISIVKEEHYEMFKNVNERFSTTKKWIESAIDTFENKEYIDNLKQEIIELTLKGQFDHIEIVDKAKGYNNEDLNILVADYYMKWGATQHALVKNLEEREKEVLLKEIIEKYLEATRLNPENYGAFNNLGIAFRELAATKLNEENYKMLQQSISNYESAAKINPGGDFIYYNWGRTLIDLSDSLLDFEKEKEDILRESVLKYTKAIELEPLNDSAYNDLGIALRLIARLKQGDEKKKLLEDSISMYKKAIQLNPQSEKTFINLGNALYDLAGLNENKEKENILRDVDSQYTSFKNENALDGTIFYAWGKALVELALVIDESNEKEYFILRGIEKFAKAAERKVDYSFTYFQWGKALYELSRLKQDEEKAILLLESIEKYQKVTELDPSNDNAFYILGKLASMLSEVKLGDEKAKYLQKSINNFRRVTELMPDDYSAFLDWGASLIELSRLKEGDEQTKLFDEGKEKILMGQKLEENIN